MEEYRTKITKLLCLYYRNCEGQSWPVLRFLGNVNIFQIATLSFSEKIGNLERLLSFILPPLLKLILNISVNGSLTEM